MKKGKNFFYRVNPCEVLSEVIFADDKEKWFLQFFNDLKNDDPDTAQIELASNLIREAHSFRAKRAIAGKTSAQQKANKSQHMLPDVEHMLPDVATNGQQTSTSKQLAVSSKQLDEQKENTCSEQDSEPAFQMLLMDGTYYDVIESKVYTWEEIYDSINVRKELAKMQQWCEDDKNKRKRKTRKGCLSFICSWLNRADNGQKIEDETEGMSLLDKEIARVTRGH